MKNFVVYKSSAGSGKTFTLVLEYLKLCLSEAQAIKYNYKKILAITFTNKAASEMKQRVIESLHQLSNSAPSETSLGKILLQQLPISEQELSKRAALVLSQILHHYSDFSIGTIDSFTHRLVKTFAFDLKLPNNFTIEMDTNAFHYKVIALLLNKIGEDDYISVLLKEFASINAENNSAWDPEKQLKEFTALLSQENATEFISKLNKFSETELESFRKQFKEYIQHYEKTLKADAAKALQFIQSNGLTDADFYYGSNGPQNYFKKCFSLQVNPEIGMGSRLKKAIDQGEWWSKTSKQDYSRYTSQLSQLATNLIEFVEQNYQVYTLSKLLSKQMYALMLLKKIDEIEQELKSEEHVVFLSEFNQKISDIIANEPTPFIYERLGEKYNHYLIDEFQDTSSLQWNNLIPLIENSLSGGHQNLLVGDGKQSIYRWRNANVIQFAALPQLLHANKSKLRLQQEQTFIRNHQAQVLSVNYRSSKEVVEFNNQFFEFTSQNTLLPEFQHIYHQHQQQTNPTKAPEEQLGYVKIELLNDKSSDKQEFYLNHLVKSIHMAIEQGFVYEDICVLVRKNSQGSQVAAHLANLNIPVISSDSLLLKNNPEVNALLAFLEYQLNPHDQISAAAILNYLWSSQKINTEAYHLALAGLGEKKSLSSVLAPHTIAWNTQSSELNNIFDTCLDAIRLLDIKVNSSLYIRFFLDEVSSFLNQYNASLSKFLEWWDHRQDKASLIIPKGSNAVHVMTIHSSKGLEFPIVIIPFCDWLLNKSNNHWVNIDSEKTMLPVAVVPLTQSAVEAGFKNEVDAETQEQLLDNLNLLYVAFTRAVSKLYVLSANSKSHQASVYHWLENFCKNHGNSSGLEFGQDIPFNRLKNKPKPSQYHLMPLQFDSNEQAVKIKSSFLGEQLLINATRKGIVLHELLAKLSNVEDIDNILLETIQKGRLVEEDKVATKELLLSILQHELLHTYFNASTHQVIEKEIAWPNGDIVRPDRVIMDKNEVIVMDYKSGQKNIKKHATQIISYAQALSNMGYGPIKKILVYLDPIEIVEVI